MFPLLLLVFVFEVLLELLPDAVPLTLFVALPPVPAPLVAELVTDEVPPVVFPPVVLPLVAEPPAALPPVAEPATCAFVTSPPVPPEAPCPTVLGSTVAAPAVWV